MWRCRFCTFGKCATVREMLTIKETERGVNQHPLYQLGEFSVHPTLLVNFRNSLSKQPDSPKSAKGTPPRYSHKYVFQISAQTPPYQVTLLGYSNLLFLPGTYHHLRLYMNFIGLFSSFPPPPTRISQEGRKFCSLLNPKHLDEYLIYSQHSINIFQMSE